MYSDLTEKQKEALLQIEGYIQENGMPPTLSELQTLLNVTSNQAVINHLDTLEEKGYIERKKTARGIRVLKGAANNEPEEKDFLELLLSSSTKKQNKKKKTFSGYSDTYALNEEEGKIITGYYNDEQY